MRDVISVAAVCLVMGGACVGRARAQDEAESAPAPVPAAEDASASVELSLSLSPTFLLALGAMQFGATGSGVGALGGLGGLSSGPILPMLDVGFALDRSVYLVLGLSGAYYGGVGVSYALSVPVSVLWYLEPPRVGRVMPMLRVGIAGGYAHAEMGGQAYDAFSLGGLVRGGITWLADRAIALRAELGVHGGASESEGLGPVVSGTIGLDAVVAVVLRV